MMELPIDIEVLIGSAVAQYGPLLLFVLGGAVLARAASRVGPRRARKLEPLRSRVWRALHPLSGPVGKRIPPTGEPRDLVREKDSDEYVATVSCSQKKLEKALYKNGWRWNPISTKKWRAHSSGKQYSKNSWVYRSSLFAPRQLHVYIFENEDGSLDIYVHQEPNFVSQPRAHGKAEKLVAGDPNDRIAADCKEYDIEYVN